MREQLNERISSIQERANGQLKNMHEGAIRDLERTRQQVATELGENAHQNGRGDEVDERGASTGEGTT